jgi:hypothetical protein
MEGASTLEAGTGQIAPELASASAYPVRLRGIFAVLARRWKARRGPGWAFPCRRVLELRVYLWHHEKDDWNRARRGPSEGPADGAGGEKTFVACRSGFGSPVAFLRLPVLPGETADQSRVRSSAWPLPRMRWSHRRPPASASANTFCRPSRTAKAGAGGRRMARAGATRAGRV